LIAKPLLQPAGAGANAEQLTERRGEGGGERAEEEEEEQEEAEEAGYWT
jgi:hypothetical protein